MTREDSGDGCFGAWTEGFGEAWNARKALVEVVVGFEETCFRAAVTAKGRRKTKAMIEMMRKTLIESRSLLSDKMRSTPREPKADK